MKGREQPNSTPDSQHPWYAAWGEKSRVAAVALLTALFLWLGANLNRQYFQTLRIPVRLSGEGEAMALHELQELEATLSMRGWDLLLHPVTRRQDTLVVPVSELRDNRIPLQARRQQIQALLSQRGVLHNISPDTLYFGVRAINTRELPVRVKGLVRFSPPYYLREAPRPDPAFVRVSGPPDKLAALQYWETLPDTLDGIPGQDRYSIGLAPARQDGVQAFPARIQLIARGVYYRELTLIRPVGVTDIPLGVSVRMAPQQLRLICLVPEDLAPTALFPNKLSFPYDSLRIADTLMLADFSMQMPAGVRILRHEPQYLRYTIIW